MSISRQSHEQQHRQSQQYDTDPEEVYDELIIGRGQICSRCFRRRLKPQIVMVPVEHEDNDATKYVALNDPETGDETAECRVFETTESVNVCHPPRVSDVFDHVNDDADIPQSWKRANPPAKTYCQCGAVDDDGTRAPLSREESLRHAKRISKRLDEADVAHSKRKLQKAVVLFKKQSWLTSKDDAIFRHAVRQAVEQVRHGTVRKLSKDDGEPAIAGEDN